jgi:glyoxylate reductase
VLPPPRVLVTRPFPGRAQDILRGARLDVEVRDEESPPSPEELRRLLRDKEGVVAVVGDALDAATIAAAPRLRAIALAVVGTDDVDLEAAAARGIVVTHTPGVLTETTADFAFALLLAAARRLLDGDRLVREGRFRGWSPTLLLGRDVHGKTIGLVGFGRIGQAVARRARGFGMSLLYASRSRKVEAETDLGARRVPLDDLLARSDFVVLCIPLARETRHLIGEAQLRRMKPSAILVNVARAGVVDDGALLDALRSGRIAAAALDVFEGEPVPLPGLLALPNVVLAPHAASASTETRAAMAEMAARDLVAVLEGREPAHPVRR